MKYLLELDGIIDGDSMRELKEIFPLLKDIFKQRKTYDEYYYKETNIDIEMQHVKELVSKYYKVIFICESVKIKY